MPRPSTVMTVIDLSAAKRHCNSTYRILQSTVTRHKYWPTSLKLVIFPRRVFDTYTFIIKNATSTHPIRLYIWELTSGE